MTFGLPVVHRVMPGIVDSGKSRGPGRNKSFEERQKERRLQRKRAEYKKDP